ncbi:MAG: iron-containing alcohol dehydrogenase [Clostridia bacterium]|nr:iron-containing alcohol dehydrogenase [Clostridia bacterium]
MLDFTYYAPTKVHFGKDKHKEVGNIVSSYGFKTVMIQYGKSSIKNSGLYDEIVASLKEHNIKIIDMGGVEPNPKISFVRKAIEVARSENVDLILAVGGGSVLDSSKYTASGALYDGDVWDFPQRKAAPQKAIPVGAVLTISAAGSEMSSSAVISNEELNMKRGYNSDFNRCLFAICNPELTFSVDKYQTACGIVDIMAHTMERYFTVCPDTLLTDRICEGLLKSVVEAGSVAMDNPNDYDARATLMWASSLSHNDLTGCGRENALCVHQLEHALSGEFDFIAHGAGLAVLFPAWARYVYKANPGRFAQFARNVWDVTEDDDEVAALHGIEKMEEYFSSIDMPLRLRDFNIDSSSTARLAELCTFGKQRTVKSYIELDYDKIKDVFDLCY